MAIKMKTWVIVLITVVAIGVFGVIGFVGLGVYAVTLHVDIDRVTDDASAQRSFKEILAKLGGRPALLAMGADGPELVETTDPKPNTRPEQAPRHGVGPTL